MTKTNHTHDPSLKSWLEQANQEDCHFPIQNLPYGVFNSADNPDKRVGVAIGDQILDLSVLENTSQLPVPAGTFARPDINAFMGLGPDVWHANRAALSALLGQDNAVLRDDDVLRWTALVPMAEARLHLPIRIGDFTDFYASREHAKNVGTMFRDPENALMPNWLHMPIGYNGRASTVVVSGTDIHRPRGQIKPPACEAPLYEACGKLDMELEIGAIIGMPNRMGQPVSVKQADEMIFGYVLLNDWSARDIQVWEYQPLGPFQAKAFATTVSPWVVTCEALVPFRVDGPAQNPTPLPYLVQPGGFNYDLDLEVSLRPDDTDVATTICRTNFKYMYWSSAQQLAHHAAGGCAMRTGDLLGSGTISGPTKDSYGSLLELSWNGQNPIDLQDGATRSFIDDGDTLVITGWSRGGGYRVGFGEAAGKILPAVNFP